MMKPKVNLGFEQITFGGFGIKFLLLKNSCNFLQMFQMFFLGLAVYQDIVQVHYDELPYIGSKVVIHQMLEKGGCSL